MLSEEVVAALFDKKLGIYTGQENRLIIIEHPLVGHDYFHGTDWAKSVDWTVMTTSKLSQIPSIPHKWVRWLRTGRLGWPIMTGHYDEVLREYGGPGFHDKTGVGAVCQDFLEEPSEGFDFSYAKESAILIGEYITALEQGEYVAPYIAWAFNEHKFATYDQLYGSGEKHHKPDSIVSAALMHRARRYTDGVNIGRAG